MEIGKQKCDEFLVDDKDHTKMPPGVKFALLEKYPDKLPEAKAALMEEFKMPAAMSELLKSKEYAELSAEFKVELLENAYAQALKQVEMDKKRWAQGFLVLENA